MGEVVPDVKTEVEEKAKAVIIFAVNVGVRACVCLMKSVESGKSGKRDQRGHN